MPLTLPYPTSPTNGDALNADTVRANIQALASGIQSFDGSQIQSGSIVEAAFNSSINPRLRALETITNFVYSGCIWNTVSGFSGTMTGGTIYVNGYRVTVSSIASHTFTASQDTYVDIDYLGNVSYVAVTNGATVGMTLTANSQRVAKVVTNGSTITSIVQTGTDPLGNGIRNLVAFAKGPASNFIGTDESTTSGSPVDLATPGPIVNIAVPSSGMVAVILTAAIYNATAGNFGYMYLTSTGANVINANGTQVLFNKAAVANSDIRQSYVGIVTGLNPGLTTFKAMYTSPGGTAAHFYSRELTVIPWGI